MTRINAGIDPKRLTNEHLLAEHREIKRICKLFRDRVEREAQGDNVSPIPPEFKLGKGHVLFFLDKPVYTYHRYHMIYQECERRGFNVTPFYDAWGFYWDYYSVKVSLSKRVGEDLIARDPEWSPAKAHIDLVAKRIVERITWSPKDTYHYFKQVMTRDEAISHLLKFSNILT